MKKILFLLMIALVVSFPLLAQKRITADEANKYIGEKVTVTGKILGGKFYDKSRNQPTVLNMGSISTPAVNIVIPVDDRKNFPYKPEEYFSQKRVSVTGRVSSANGKPEIFIDSVEDIKLVEAQGGGVEIKPLDFESFNRFFNE